ncbi:hypothetical protein acdb102_40940 [Acidothermaceae bacterium B102]|nr:hypothetical protein acdb102_40940 [Acidothermaceae bacterium B102]
MRRRTLDALLTTGGLVVAAVLLIAGGLLTYGHSFVHNEVKTQLAAQQIFFPAAGSPGLADPAIKPYLTKYAGKQLLTGVEAKAFADHYIAVHLKAIGGGKTYSQLSAEAIAAPTDTVLAGKVATVFKGETLRGLLLNAYAFDTMGTLALIAAIVAFSGAGLMLVLSGLGFLHLRKVSRQTDRVAVDRTPTTV